MNATRPRGSEILADQAGVCTATSIESGRDPAPCTTNSKEQLPTWGREAGRGVGGDEWDADYIVNQQELAFPCTGDKEWGSGRGGWVGGGVKLRTVRWGRAHSAESLSCGAPRILLAENPSVVSARNACPGPSLKRMRQDPAGGDKTKNFSFFFFNTVVLNKGKRLFRVVFWSKNNNDWSQ